MKFLLDSLYHDHSSSASASHPVGTTVRVQDFLSKIPVRKQTALKETTKVLQAIRTLLFAFAFARPEIRFSLKVLKGKNDKINWTYAPTLSDSVGEVAAKIVGKEIASECTAHTVVSDDCDANVGHGWKIEALLISRDIGMSTASFSLSIVLTWLDPTKIRNSTQYVAVDGRPVSTDRSTMKEIAKSYKRYVQNILLSSDRHSISRPFFMMQIMCPPESYDVNVEPAKDEVLFFRPDHLLSLVECLFTRALEHHKRARKESPDMASSSADLGTTPVPLRNMYGPDLNDFKTDENPTEEEGPNKSIEPEHRAAQKENLSNPFTIAAMTKVVKPRKMNTSQTSSTSGTNADASPNNEVEEPFEEVPVAMPTAPRTPLGQGSHLPSPRHSSLSPVPFQNPGPPLRRQIKVVRQVEAEDAELSASDNGAQPLSLTKTSLQAWLTPNSVIRRPDIQRIDRTSPQYGGSPTKVMFNPSAGHSQSHSKMMSHPNSSGGLKWGPGQKPFKPPLKRDSGALDLHPPQNLPGSNERALETRIPTPSGSGQGGEWQSTLVSSTTVSLDHNELKDIMEFEHRKKAAIAHQRMLATRFPPASLKEMLHRTSRPGSPDSVSGFDDRNSLQRSAEEDDDAKFGSFRAATPKKTGVISNPHHNRYLAALRDLSDSHLDPTAHLPLSAPGADTMAQNLGLDIAIETPRLSDDDPRAHLMRQLRESGHGKLHRTKFSKLPFETIPAETTTVGLLIISHAFKNLTGIRQHTDGLASTDNYLTLGTIDSPNLSNISTSILGDWEVMLRNMVKTKYRFKAEDGRAHVPHLKFRLRSVSDGELT